MTIKQHRNSIVLYRKPKAKPNSESPQSTPSLSEAPNVLELLPTTTYKRPDVTHGTIILCFDPSSSIASSCQSSNYTSEEEINTSTSEVDPPSSPKGNEESEHNIATEKEIPSKLQPARSLSRQQKEELMSDMRRKGNLLEEYMFLRERRSALQVYNRYARMNKGGNGKGSVFVYQGSDGAGDEAANKKRATLLGSLRRGHSAAVLERGVTVGGI